MPAAKKLPELHPDHVLALVEGRHPQPHATLGQHPIDGGFIIRAIRPLAKTVTAVLVGMGPGDTGEVPLSLIQNREIWVTGTFRYANTYPTAIALAASGRVDLEAIITGHYGLDETDSALRAGMDDPGSVKVMVHP